MVKDPNAETGNPVAPTVTGIQRETVAMEGRGFFGHPRGLATLFFTEMWERFSYYGMRALLVLFMTAAAMGENPGLGFDVGKATAIYGLFTSLVYLLALPGGWVADKLWGQRRAVFVGGIFIAAGNFCLAIPGTTFFYLGLLGIIIGTGLLKPNVSTMVGDLYPEGGARRDAGFSIFYMGINIGALIAPLIVGFFGENINWHLGFAASGIGMTLGLIQYKVGGRHLGDAGTLKNTESAELIKAQARRFFTIAGVVTLVVVLIVTMAVLGVFSVPLQVVATYLGYSIIVIVFIYFAYLLANKHYNKMEKRRIGVIMWLFILAAMFWAGFEQAGSSLNIFARDLTQRTFFGFEMPASWLQSINPIFIITFAPIFGWLWVWLARRKANPSIPVKFALGLILLATAFFVIMWGASNATETDKASPAWLVVMYFLFTVGELSLSPVGLSSITKLAPRDRVGQMMGIWFIAASLGNLFAGVVAGRLESLSMEALFFNVALFTGATGIVALVASPFVRKLMGHIE
jgi:POT family proton-dependent oligopeptide transporter